MAFDPTAEDFTRVLVRHMTRNRDVQPADVQRFAVEFQMRYVADRDTIEQDDTDRAFHLVNLATDIIDYQIPFSTESEVDALAEEGRSLLEEAIKLDSECWDAHRMLAMGASESQEDYYQYLVDKQPKVLATCKRRYEELPEWFRTNGWAGDEGAAVTARYICMAPYLRWLASMASEALVSGRYTLAINHYRALIDRDPSDTADAYLTAMLACAKLGNITLLQEIDDSRGKDQPTMEAWRLLSYCGALFRAGEIDSASECLELLCQRFPDGGDILYQQEEFFGGVFARPLFEIGTKDELLFAVSEAIVLLQEGFDPAGHGILGEWVRNHPAVQRLRAQGSDSKGDQR